MLWAASAPLTAQNGARPLTVRHVEIEGNRAIDDFTLRASIETTESAWLARFPLTGWVGWGRRPAFDETEFRRDVLRLLVLYRQTGYIDARVDTVVVRGRDHVDIRFRITEGEPVRVTSLSVRGTEGIIPPEQLIRDLPLREGDPFDQGRLILSTDSIRLALQNRGYPFTTVYRGFSVQYAERTAEVEFLVDPGPAARIDSIEVIGPPDLDPTLVRKTIRLQPGQRFNQTALYQSQQELYRMGVFDFVDVRLLDSVPRGPDDSLVTVTVQVSRGRLHSIRVGGGYGTNDCFRTLTSWTARNFLGGGRSLALTAGFSKIGTGPPFDAGFEENICRSLDADAGSERLDLNYNLSASLRFPTVLSPRRSATVTVFAEQFSEFQAYIRQAIGFDLSLTQQTKWNIPVTLSYSLSYGSTRAEDAVFCSLLRVCRVEDAAIFREDRVKATAGVLLVRDRTNSPINPTRGTALTLEARIAAEEIGSDPEIEFAKSLAEFSSYHPLGRQTVFAWRLRWGLIRSPDLRFEQQDVRFIPTEERFYGGGSTTVRGFRQNELGPVVYVDEVTFLLDSAGQVVDSLPRDSSDILVSPTGGNAVFIANAELRFPLSRSGRLAGVLFVDIGRVVDRTGPEEDPGFRVTPVAGVRVFTPLGPVRLDVAYNPHGPERGPLFRQECTRTGQTL
ncbi:MAG: BamA/TamA family outer membrane protein, partial [Gemmatimonadetes bacterium]|nr:BamA/TamA family outer membrane protein [Gemmatimonadota bacterium]